MNEIICPHCQKAFKVDEAGYADLLKQVRNQEFDQELHQRLELAQKDKQAALDLAQAQATSQLQASTAEKDREIASLKAQLQAGDLERRLAITEAVGRAEKERDQFKNGLERTQLEKELAEKSLKDKYETQLKDRDSTIERLRDLKSKLSTKMLGETLEQHCEIEFNRIRATAFPHAYFEKDNDASSGSKGTSMARMNRQFMTRPPAADVPAIPAARARDCP